MIDGDNVLAGKLRSVAIDRNRVLFGTTVKQGEFVSHLISIVCCL